MSIGPNIPIPTPGHHRTIWVLPLVRTPSVARRVVFRLGDTAETWGHGDVRGGGGWVVIRTLERQRTLSPTRQLTRFDLPGGGYGIYAHEGHVGSEEAGHAPALGVPRITTCTTLEARSGDGSEARREGVMSYPNIILRCDTTRGACMLLGSLRVEGPDLDGRGAPCSQGGGGSRARK